MSWTSDIISNLSRLTSHWTKESIHPKCQQACHMYNFEKLSHKVLLNDTFFHIFFLCNPDWTWKYYQNITWKKATLHCHVMILLSLQTFLKASTLSEAFTAAITKTAIFAIACFDQRPKQGQARKMRQHFFFLNGLMIPSDHCPLLWSCDPLKRSSVIVASFYNMNQKI